jgi:hypothetical protein
VPNSRALTPCPRVIGAFCGVLGVALGVGACADQTAPRPAPTGGVVAVVQPDAPRPGPMVIVCRDGKPGCVPTYAVACLSPAQREDAAAVWWLTSGGPDQAWCAARGNGTR